MNQCQPDGVDQVISINNVYLDKEKNDQILKVMNLLEGSEETALVVQGEELPTSSSESVLIDSSYETVSKENLTSENIEMIQSIAKISNTNSIDLKKKEIYKLIKNNMQKDNEELMEVGNIFDIDKTYDSPVLTPTHDDGWRDDEFMVQEFVTNSVYLDLHTMI